jgi:hypothetical protein
VRTYTDLATMEGANEAARRAVNGILEASGSDAPRCAVWQLHEPDIFAPWRELDFIRYSHGLPWDDTVVNLALSFGQLVDQAVLTLERNSEKHNIFLKAGVLPFGQDEIVSLFERDNQSTVTSTLRRDAIAVIERLVRVLALRFAENEGASGAGRSTVRTRPRKVQIVPR